MARPIEPMRILVADDYELTRRGIGDLLRRHRNWKVVGEARDGLETIRKAKKLRPDVIILDITMPKLDGIEAIRQLKGADPQAKILVLTMHESYEMVRRVLEAGALGYMLKSDLAARLATAVRCVSQSTFFLTPRAAKLMLEGFLKSGQAAKIDRPKESRLTPREEEIVRLLASGKVNKEIAAALGITVRTVETHRAKIMLKLNLHSLAELIHYAIRTKLVSAEDL